MKAEEIEQRIRNEYRKHKNIDWAKIAAKKIHSTLQSQLKESEEEKKKLEAAFINHAPTEIVKEYFNLKTK